MWNGSCHSHAGIRIYGSWHPRSCGHSSAKSWFTSARHERKTRVSNGSTFTSRTSAPCRTVNRKEPIIAGAKPSPQKQRNFRIHIRNRFQRSGRSENRKPNGSEQVIQTHKAFSQNEKDEQPKLFVLPARLLLFLVIIFMRRKQNTAAFLYIPLDLIKNNYYQLIKPERI